MKLRAGVLLLLVSWAGVFGQGEDTYDQDYAPPEPEDEQLRQPPPPPPPPPNNSPLGESSAMDQNAESEYQEDGGDTKQPLLSRSNEENRGSSITGKLARLLASSLSKNVKQWYPRNRHSKQNKISKKDGKNTKNRNKKGQSKNKQGKKGKQRRG